MIQKLLFCFTLILCIETSCKDNVTVCKPAFVDSSYRYSIEEFEKLRAKIEGKKLDVDRLKCKFKSVYSTETSDDFVNYAFVLRMLPETMDTCWGVINYDNKTNVVKKCGVFCQ